MTDYKMVYISEEVVERISQTNFGKYLDDHCCMTNGRQIVYRVNERTLKRLQREYHKEMKGGLIRILD